MLTFLFFLYFSIHIAADQHSFSSCLSSAATEAEAQTCFSSSDVTVGLEKDQGSKLLESLLLRGFFDSAELLLTSARSTGLDLSTTLHQASSSIRTKLQSLADNLQNAVSSIKSKSEGKAGIAPAAEWAQSPDSIFLNVKFSHKLDAPATLGCELDGAPTFTSNGLKLFAECKEKRKAFSLDLALFREISPENCSFSITSVGRASITLKKTFNSSWPRLLIGKAKPGNIHVWWAMKEKYSEELSAWEKADAAQRAAKPKNHSANDSNETSVDAASGESTADGSSASNTNSSGVEASPSSTPEPLSPSEAALQKAFKLLESLKAKDQRTLERQESEEIASAADRNVRYKRGVDEAAKGQKEDADKRYEEQKKSAQEKKQKAVSDLNDRYQKRRKLAEDRLMAAGARGIVDNVDADSLIAEEIEEVTQQIPEATATVEAAAPAPATVEAAAPAESSSVQLAE